VTESSTKQPTRPYGTPVWNDVDTPDADAARTFYTSLFGWDAGTQGDGGFGTFSHVDGLSGTTRAAVEGRHPAIWTTYFSTDDVDATTAKVLASGGQVEVPATAIGSDGSVALFVDPSGASFGVWQAASGDGADAGRSHVKAIWNELHSRDIDAASRFYKAVFGWESEATPFGEIDYTYWKLRDTLVAGGIPLAAVMPADSPSHWVAIFAVKSCEEMVARARGLHAGVILEPTRSEDGLYAFVQDPQGAIFGVISP
jgi:predicted enzyme related to lactoylglutathione lyase